MIPTSAASPLGAAPGKEVRARRDGVAATPSAAGVAPFQRRDPARTVGTHAEEGAVMRIASSVTSISWIPSEAVTGLNKGIFESGFTHYDDPPPDHVTDLDALRDADGFRFANHLSVWIDVEDGRIVACGRGGGGLMGATTVRLGKKAATLRGGRARGSPSGPRAHGDQRPLRADHGRPHRAARASTRQPATVRAVHRPRRSGPRSR